MKEKKFEVTVKYVINEATMIRDYMFLKLIEMMQHGYIDVIKKHDIVYVNPFGFNKNSKYCTVGKFVVTDVKPRKHEGALLTLSNGVRFVTISELYTWRQEDIENIIMKDKEFNPEKFMDIRKSAKECNIQLPLIDYVPCIDYSDDNFFNAIEYASNISGVLPKLTDVVYYNNSVFPNRHGVSDIISIQTRIGNNPLITIKEGEKESKMDSSYLWTRQEIIDRINIIN